MVKIIDYSAKSIAVIGDTKPIRSLLKSLGGKFNSRLTINGSFFAGWIFSAHRSKQVEDTLTGNNIEYKRELPENINSENSNSFIPDPALIAEDRFNESQRRY